MQSLNININNQAMYTDKIWASYKLLNLRVPPPAKTKQVSFVAELGNLPGEDPPTFLMRRLVMWPMGY